MIAGLGGIPLSLAEHDWGPLSRPTLNLTLRWLYPCATPRARTGWPVNWSIC